MEEKRRKRKKHAKRTGSGSRTHAGSGAGKVLLSVLAVCLLVALIAVLLRFSDTGFIASVKEYFTGSLSTAVRTSRQGIGSGLVINEVVSSNKRSLLDDVYGSPDWIELYNTGSDPIDLTGYGMSDNIRNFHKYEFGTVVIAPGEFYVLYCCEPSGDPDSSSRATGFGLSRSGDSVYITDNYYGLLLQMDVPTLPTDVSWARRPDGTYGYCAVPTPGRPNGEIVDSTDDLFDFENLSGLTISEVMPRAKGTDAPWVELLNRGTTAVRLENYYLTDNPLNPQRWQLPERTLEPGGRVVVYLSGLDLDGDEMHASFRLGKADTVLVLTDYTGNERGRFLWDADILPGYAVVGDPPVYTYEPTPGAENSSDVFTDVHGGPMESSDPVRLNEALRVNRRAAADMDGDRSEWVEIRNDSSYAQSLNGYFLSDDERDLLKWGLPDVQIAPYGYVLVFLSGKDRTEGELHASFRLGEGETKLYLTRASGLRTDTLEVPDDLAADVSVGWDSSGNYRYFAKPTPGYANGYGFESADMIGFFNSDGVYITEVCGAHKRASGEIDWIELHNGGKADADLSGWKLADDADGTRAILLDGVAIPSGGYAVFSATANSAKRKAGMGEFGVSRDGDTLYLIDAQGHTVDSFSSGMLRAGITAGRIEGEESVRRVYFTTPTKGRANDRSSVTTGYSPAPVFSDTLLYHEEAFDLTITCRDPYAVIRYTTDGTKPTQKSKALEGTLRIERNTVLRAASFSPGLMASEISTVTYLFEEPHTIPVVSMIMPSADFEVINATKDRENKPERESYIQFYEANGLLGTEFPCGLKAKGAGTLAYRQKSFTLHLKDSYGMDSVTYPFYRDVGYPFTTFSALALRNSGQDYDYTRIKNSFFSRATYGMYVDSAMTRPVVLYVNGAYWGLYDLDEDLNKDYLATHYGVDPHKVDIIRRNQTALAGSNKDFLSVRDMGRNGSTNRDSVFEQYAERVDVDYFTDYLIAQTFFFNNDMFNQKYWRSQDGTVKWRPVCFDQDFLLNSYTRNLIGNFFSYDGVASNNGTTSNMDCFIGLKKNKSWCQYYARRYVQLICTQLSAERLTSLLDEMAAVMRPEMARHIARWKRPSSVDAWEKNLAVLRTHLEKRPEIALQHVREYFGISRDQIDAWVAEFTPAE